jgi:hypothetical protein
LRKVRFTCTELLDNLISILFVSKISLSFPTFRLCGPGSTSRLTNLCNPTIGDEWVDGYNTEIKDVAGRGGF